MLSTTLVLIVILGAEGQPDAKMPLGKATTYFTEPLDKEGYVDYQAALNRHLGKGVSPDTNANVLLWKALGRAPGGERVPAKFFKLLGIEAPPTDGHYYVDLRTFLEKHAKLDLIRINSVTQQQILASQRPWKQKDYPQIASWLAVNETPLAVVIEASQRPDYFNPVIAEESDEVPSALALAPIPGVKVIRELGQALAARAMLRVGEEKFDEAWRDLLACHRLGRLLARNATTAESHAGFFIDRTASNADVAYLERRGQTEALDHLTDLQNLQPLPQVADKIDLGERIQFLDALQLIRRGKLRAENLSSDSAFRNASAAELKALDRIDWSPALRNSNHWFDRLAATMRVEDRTERRRMLVKIRQDLGSAKTTTAKSFAKLILDSAVSRDRSSEEIGSILISVMLPVAEAGHIFHDRADQIQRNLQVAFALAAYQSDRRRYPDKLAELTPKYLATAPNDLFSGKPLVYRPTKGGYLLYSVGFNGKDDDGRSDDNGDRDDLSVQIPLPTLKVGK